MPLKHVFLAGGALNTDRNNELQMNTAAIQQAKLGGTPRAP